MREEKITEFEEEKQRTFIPSAVGVPLKPLFRCDKQCSEKTLSFWQPASAVVNEGQKCFSKHLQARGEEPLTNVQWRQVVEKKAYRGRMWRMMGKVPYLRWMWEHFSSEKIEGKEISTTGRLGKAGGNTRAVAAGIASQRILGASEMLP